MRTVGSLQRARSASPTSLPARRRPIRHSRPLCARCSRTLAALAEARGANFDDLDAAGRIAVVEALEQEAPDAFTALLWHTYMGYYSRADVRPHFGLSDRPTQPEGYELPEDDPDELADMLAPVRARGRCYRPS